MAEMVPSVKIKTKGDISGIITIVNEIRQKPNSCLPHFESQNVQEAAVGFGFLFERERELLLSRILAIRTVGSRRSKK